MRASFGQQGHALCIPLYRLHRCSQEFVGNARCHRLHIVLRAPFDGEPQINAADHPALKRVWGPGADEAIVKLLAATGWHARHYAPDVVARFTARDVQRLLKNDGIVRHRGKIEAAIGTRKDEVADEITRR